MLNSELIGSQVEDLLNSTAGLELEAAKLEFKKQLTELIINAIKSATITIQPGIITVQGSPSAQSNISTIVIDSSIT